MVSQSADMSRTTKYYILEVHSVEQSVTSLCVFSDSN